MDPSEFEGTIAKNEDFLSAGALEDILLFSKGKLNTNDIGKDIAAVQLHVYAIKESLETWSALNLESSKDELDVQALKIAEFKEECIGRKKNLGSIIRNFNKTCKDTEHISAAAIFELAKSLIDDFKANFDYLSDAVKFSDSCFFGAYKMFRELPGISFLY